MLEYIKFYKEIKLKNTEIGRIPEDWNTKKLEEVCLKIKSGGTPLRSINEYWNGDIPFVKIEDITNSGKYLYRTTEYITKKGLENSNAWIVPKDSILLAIYGSLGEVAINRIEVATNQAILGIIPNPKILYNEFLYYWLLYFKPNWKRYAKPTTQANLTAEIVKNIKIPLPPLEEQKAIAEVLSTIDKEIENIKKAIENTEKLKKATMNLLLTGKIRIKNENGKFIFYKETKFKDTEIGKIPEDWEIKELIKIAKIRNTKKVDINKNEEVAFIPMEKIPLDGLYCQYEIKKFYEIKSYVYCEAGDILLAKITPSFENGKQGIVPDIPIKIILTTTEVYPIFITENVINRLYLFYLLKFEKFRKELENRMRGTTGRRRVPREALEKLKIPLPPLEEQKAIAEVLSTIDKRKELLQKKKEVMEKIKKWFMQKLLTGEIRIKMI